MVIKENKFVGSMKEHPRGSALLVVLGVVMVITILSLAFISRSNIDLACGENMLLKVKMDYLAESGLEHARGLIINPQVINPQVINPQEIALEGEYWKGDQKQSFSMDGFYYDVEVEPNEFLSGNTRWRSYDISSEAYKLSGGDDKIAKSSLKAILTLYPAVAFWSDSAVNQLSSSVTINGDAYFAGSLSCSGRIDGDVFCDGVLSEETKANITGRQKERSELLSLLQWPDINTTVLDSKYTFVSVSSPLSETVSGYYLKCDSNDLTITGDVVINGILMVEGNLVVEGTNKLEIVAQKNLPALLVTGDLIISADASLDIKGLVIVQRQVKAETGSGSLNILGGLFTRGGIEDGNRNITITAAPPKTAIYVGEQKKWSQAPTAFFQDIRRD